MNLKKLSLILVATFIVLSVLLIVTISTVGGPKLLGYLAPTLIEGFGLAIAATASLFFFLRLVWRLHALPMGISMLFFLLGVGMFVSVSVGRVYALQYPVFVQSFGPGHGPGLPLKNILSFFQQLEKFPQIVDIARDPSDVPPAISILGEYQNPAQADSLTATGTIESLVTGFDKALMPVDMQTEPDKGGTVREIYLETTEVLSEIAPGITFNYWTFNDTVPGPFFRVREGDTVIVKIHNKDTNLHNHNVDFHAATGPGGGGAVSVVAPGETKEFKFKAMNPGLFVYHCAVPNMALHMAHGMYGLMLVEPKEGLPKVDKEFYVMQGELYTTGTLGRPGLQIFDAKKMMNGIPEYVTFNGRPSGLMNKMKARVGDKVRFYVGNGGVANISSFHIVGEIFDNVYPEASIGGAMFHNVQTTIVPAGGAAIVEFTVDYPGNYVLVDHALMRTDKGAWGVLEVTGEANLEIFKGDFSLSEEASAH